MTVRLAFAGDVHGDLDHLLRRVVGLGVDAIVQVGDFESVRTEADLPLMTGPKKYRKLGDFGAYWRGERRVPVPIFFIGGNHEIYRTYLEHHPRGAELAPGIRYLGRYGVGVVAGVRMAWLSGIYNPASYDGSYPGTDELRRVSGKRFTYFYWEDVVALDRQVTEAGGAEVFLFHDWPRGIEREAVEPSPRPLVPERQCAETYELIVQHRPSLVFCGHMHVGFRSRIGRTQVECLGHIDRDDSIHVVDFPAAPLEDEIERDGEPPIPLSPD